MFLTSHIDFCSFLDNVEININKTVSGKKSRGHQMSKIVKSRQSYSNGHLNYHNYPFYNLASALPHDVACKFACAVWMRRTWQLARTSLIRQYASTSLYLLIYLSIYRLSINLSWNDVYAWNWSRHSLLFLKPTWRERTLETSLVWNLKIVFVVNLVLVVQSKGP